MPSVDLRTKSNDDLIEGLTLDQWLSEVAPGLLARHGDVAARGFRTIGKRPLALDVEGDCFTFGGDPFVRPGIDDEAIVVELDRLGFSDLMQEQRTATAFLTAGVTTVRNGSIFDFVAWDPVLRALIDGRPVHEPGMVDFVDLDGRPLDLNRSFSPADSDVVMGHFLAEAGFLHLSDWFSPSVMPQITSDIRDAVPGYEREDGRSWWAKTADGTDRCVRLLDFVDQSPTTAELLDSAQHLRIGTFTDDRHSRGALRGRTAQALIKPVGVTEGISDVPWHKDCSLGRHSFSCCSMTVGISVTRSDEASGQLCVIAGSHRANIPMLFVDGLDLPTIPLPTKPGDVTIHLSCTMHMSMPPTTGERLVLYTGFGLPPRSNRLAEGESWMRGVLMNAPNTISQDPRYTG